MTRLRNQRGRLGLRVLHVHIEPRDPARPLIEIGLLGGRTVILVRIHVERRVLPEAAERLHHAHRARQIRTAVLIFERVVHEDGAAETIGREEGRHVEVGVLALPDRATLVLEAVRGQRAVVHAVAGDARLEVRRVRHRVHRAERAVAVTTDTEAVAIEVAGLVDGVDRKIEILAQLILVVIVHAARRSDDRDVDRLDHDVALRDPDLRAARGDVGERVDVRRATTLIVLLLRRELRRVEPDDARETCAFAIVARKGHVDVEVVVVARTRDENALANRLRHFRRVIDVLRELRLAARLHVAQVRVGDHRRRLLGDDHLRVIIVQRSDDVFGDVGLALEQAGLVARLDVDLVDEAVRRLLRPIAEVLRALEVDALAVAAEANDRRHVGAALDLLRTRRVVEGGVALRAAAATRAGTGAATTTAATGRDRATLRDLVVLARIGKLHGVEVIAFLHEQHLTVRAELGRRDAAVRLEDLLRVARGERRSPGEDAVLAVRRGVAAACATAGAAATGGVTATGRRRFLLEVHEARANRVPADVALAGIRTGAATTTARGRARRITHAILQRTTRELGDDLAVGVPQLLDGAELRHLDEVGVGLLLERDAEVLPVRRDVDVGDHRRLADLLDGLRLGVDDGELAHRVVVDELEVGRRLEEALIVAVDLRGVRGARADERSRGDRGLLRLRSAVVREE